MIHLRGASFVYQAPDGEVEALRQVAVLCAASVCACDAKYAGAGRGRLYRSLLWQQGNS